MDTSKKTGGSSPDAGSTPKNNSATANADGDTQLYYAYKSGKVIIQLKLGGHHRKVVAFFYGNAN